MLELKVLTGLTPTKLLAAQDPPPFGDRPCDYCHVAQGLVDGLPVRVTTRLSFTRVALDQAHIVVDLLSELTSPTVLDAVSATCGNDRVWSYHASSKLMGEREFSRRLALGAVLLRAVDEANAGGWVR